ncbi:MAG: DUF1127 domain-containing protein [Proteobacteria bacterium]|nr:DUF1127 domain-containing protein [Pseudomonadota bacterium]
MTTQTSSNIGTTGIIGAPTQDLPPQVSSQDSLKDSVEIMAAAQTLRSEEVGKFMTIAARFIGRVLGPVFRAIGEFFGRRQEMAELMRLNDRELADIGLSRGDLYAAQRSHERVHVPANENLPRYVA